MMPIFPIRSYRRRHVIETTPKCRTEYLHNYFYNIFFHFPVFLEINIEIPEYEELILDCTFEWYARLEDSYNNVFTLVGTMQISKKIRVKLGDCSI